jgi:spoIIIJ-associated protein
MAKDKAKIVKEEAQKLLELMGSAAAVEVVEDKENEAVQVNLESPEEAGLLIGRHGETILAIQTILGMLVKQKVGEWVRILVNIGDWREKERVHLEDLATQAATRAKEMGEPQSLYNLSASQRRIIHLFLAKDAQVKTESQGEGKERFLVIRKA